MTKPLYLTGSAALAGSARRPNKALQNDITASVLIAAPHAVARAASPVPAFLGLAAPIVWAMIILLVSFPRIHSWSETDAESLLGDLLSFDLRSAKSRGLCQTRAGGDRTIRRPLHRARHCGGGLRSRPEGTHRHFGISEPGKGDRRL